jgi:hypothetical protein
MTRSRYEVILADLRILRQKAVELEAVLLDWSPNLAAGPPGRLFQRQSRRPSPENQARRLL